MRLLRVGPAGEERPALLDERDVLRDLSGVLPVLDGAALAPAALNRLRAIDPATLPAITGRPRIGPPIPCPRNFICVGLNYADHAAETGSPLPREPILFLKSLGAFSGPEDDIVIPPGAEQVDWEAELGVVIGTTARAVPDAEAMQHVAGFCVVNDVSERAWQLKRGGTWDKGKGADSFGPVGPWLVTTDAVPDPQALAIWLEVDGERMQNGSTAAMVFPVAALVAYASRFFTLHPGDIIATGTPPGVGMSRNPPRFLQPGQTVRLGVGGLGEQCARVRQG